jgi:hypothetical protein
MKLLRGTLWTAGVQSIEETAVRSKSYSALNVRPTDAHNELRSKGFSCTHRGGHLIHVCTNALVAGTQQSGAKK